MMNQQQVYHPSSQGFATVQADLGHYADAMGRSVALKNNSPVPADDHGGYAPPTPPTSSLTEKDAKEAIMEVVERLQEMTDENTKLREKLTKVQEEKRKKTELALKATQFAERLRSDNMQLQSDLKIWEDRIGQLEDVFAKRQTQQEDVLVDIESQLDQLITEYETDLSNTTTLQTSAPN